MTSHPKDLSRKLVDLIASSERILSHIHLPLQSGANRILEKMGRIYTVEHYLKIVEYIKKNISYVSLTTDLIVGFPSETEEEYEATLKAVKEVQYDAAFMFRYSVRPGTTAAKFEDDIPEDVKIRRLNNLITLQQKISYKQNQREINQIRFSLVEGKSKKSKSSMRARTEGNKTVLFEAGDYPAGTVLPIKIISADAFTLHGQVMETN